MLVIRPFCFIVVVVAFVVSMWLRVNMHIRETFMQRIHTRTLLEKDETPERAFRSYWNEMECEREKACEKEEEEEKTTTTLCILDNRYEIISPVDDVTMTMSARPFARSAIPFARWFGIGRVRFYFFLFRAFYSY